MTLVMIKSSFDRAHLDLASQIANAERQDRVDVIRMAILSYIRYHRSDPGGLRNLAAGVSEHAHEALELLIYSKPSSSLMTSVSAHGIDEREEAEFSIDSLQLGLLQALAFLHNCSLSDVIHAALDYYLPMRKEELGGDQGLASIAEEIRRESD